MPSINKAPHGSQLQKSIKQAFVDGDRVFSSPIGIFDNSVNVKWFGAVGDGVADDTAAIQAALDTVIIDNNRLHFPAGDYVISSKISVSGNYSIQITTDGTENTRIIYNNINSALEFIITDWKSGNVSIDDLTIIGSANGLLANPVIYISYATITSPSFSFSGPVIRNFIYTNDTTRNTTLSDSILKFNNASHCLIERAYITGVSFSGIGIRFVGESISCKVSSSYVHNVSTGISVEGASEGGEFTSSNIVGNTKGIVYNTTLSEPGGLVSDCHFNNREKNIEGVNRSQLPVMGCLLYRQAGGPTGFTDILIGSGSSNWTVSDNIIITDPVADGTSIGIDIQAGNVHTITDNHIRQRDTGIKIASGVGNSIIDNNNTKSLTKPIDHLANQSNRVRNGEFMGSYATLNLTTQSIVTSGTAQILDWDGVTVSNAQSDSEFYSSGTVTRILVPTGTFTVIVSANIVFATNSTGYRRVAILKNGAVFAGMADMTGLPPNAVECRINITTGNVEVVDTDYFEVRVTQTSGGGLNVLSGNPTNFTLSVVE